MEYEAVIGMEVHAELSTRSKMFCACDADFFGADENTHVCPVCMGFPGVLPVVNEQAIAYAVRVGLALNCQIAAFSKFDRKNYTYPDLPKGYQISQYDLPLCLEGWLDIEVGGATRRIGIRRAHLEEDTAKEYHVEGASLVDFNRSGVPLLEIVTEPDIRSGEEARSFLVQLRAILRALGVSTADMEKGAMRCEPNVSVRPMGRSELGVKTEIKNLNSFRSVKQAIEYEIERHINVLEAGGTIEQVTMGWNERDNRTVVQRSKEYAQDYRYFPEPDLAPLELSPAYVSRIRAALPELPSARRDRLVASYGLRVDDAEILATEAELGDFYEACVAEARSHRVAPAAVCNWITGEMFRLLNEHGVSIADAKVDPVALAELLGEVERGTINANTGKAVLSEMFASGERAPAIIAAEGLAQVSDEERLRQLVVRAVSEHEEALQQYMAGKSSVIGFFIGQVMRASQGKANPQVVRSLLQAHLEDLRARDGAS